MKQQVTNRFEIELDFLIEQLYQLNSYRLLYKHLNDKKSEEVFLQAMNIAPAFFSLSIHSYQHMFVMGLSKLCEKRNSNGKNIFNFLDFLEKNFMLIFSNNELKINQFTINTHTINNHRDEIEKHSACITNVTAWRDKSFAHFDKKYGSENSPSIGEDFPIIYGDMVKLIDLLGEVLNTYQSAYKGSVTSIKPSNTYDVDKVLQTLIKHYAH